MKYPFVGLIIVCIYCVLISSVNAGEIDDKMVAPPPARKGWAPAPIAPPSGASREKNTIVAPSRQDEQAPMFRITPPAGGGHDTVIIEPSAPESPKAINAPDTAKNGAKKEGQAKLSPADFLPLAPENHARKSEKFHADENETLQIPADITKNDVPSFLEGCWQGKIRVGQTGDWNKYYQVCYAPHTAKSAMPPSPCKLHNVRFCFNANGKGKIYQYDSAEKETCTGTASGSISDDGTLLIKYNDTYCPSGTVWTSAEYLTCKNKDGQTQCSWHLTKGKHNGATVPSVPFVKN